VLSMRAVITHSKADKPESSTFSCFFIESLASHVSYADFILALINAPCLSRSINVDSVKLRLIKSPNLDIEEKRKGDSVFFCASIHFGLG